jgi:hypothetical protein
MGKNVPLLFKHCDVGAICLARSRVEKDASKNRKGSLGAGEGGEATEILDCDFRLVFGSKQFALWAGVGVPKFNAVINYG